MSTAQLQGPFANRFYNIRVDFADGSEGVYEFMSLGDTLTIVATFDKLDIANCVIEVAP